MDANAKLCVDHLNIKFILDDTIIPHIETSLYTKTMSGMISSSFNLIVYSKRVESLTSVIEFLKEYIKIMRIKSNAVSFDLNPFTPSKGLDDYEYVAEIRKMCTAENDYSEDNVASSVFIKPNTNFARKSIGGRIESPLPVQSIDEPDFSGGVVLQNSSIMRKKSPVSFDCSRYALLLAEHIKKNPIGVPDMKSRTLKGRKSINNYINTVLGKIFAEDDALAISVELFKHIK